MTGGKGARIEVFGFDGAEISQIRRTRALRAQGFDAQGFSLRRGGETPRDIDWIDTDLGRTRPADLGDRACAVARAILRCAPHRARLRAARLILARNLDMLAIALAARAMAGAGRVPVVYECLDIHAALTGTGPRARAMRAIERRLMARTQLLVTSSPGFLLHHFRGAQRYRGPYALWENRIAAGADLPPRPRLRPRREGPLRLGWVGALRCAPSLRLLAGVATRMGAGVEIHLHGHLHHHALPDVAELLAAHPNMHHHGPYRWPEDLARIYEDLDLVWAQDLWQRGGNSDWLLPNRLYEAGWAGCPSLALTETETGMRIEDRGLGWTLSRADPATLAAWLERMPRAAITARRAALLARPEAEFVQSGEELRAPLGRLLAPDP